jgi:NTE family protein
MIGLALSGGGSRAMAFHLGCLRALHDLEILGRIRVISTISGGSLIGAYYAYTPEKSFAEFETDIREFLEAGFQHRIALQLLNPINLIGCLTSSTLTHAAELVAFLTGREPRVRRFLSRSELFHRVLQHHVFGDRLLSAPRRNGVDIVIGACELRYGTAFRFGNDLSGDYRHGRLVSNDIDVAFAVAASAAYPIFLPAFDRSLSFHKCDVETKHRVCLTDGGVYDNLGIQVLEPNRDPNVSLHCFPCSYLIVCNAGQGQEAGTHIPLGFFRRVERSLGIVHRRVQDSSMNRLHYLRTSGKLKGFILPYLGQIDERLPWKPPNLVPREDVIGYPTNFAAMTPDWIDRLSARGEQLTRCLVSQYLPEVVL